MPVYNNILVLKILGMRNIEILTCWSENQLWSLLRGGRISIELNRLRIFVIMKKISLTKATLQPEIVLLIVEIE